MLVKKHSSLKKAIVTLLMPFGLFSQTTIHNYLKEYQNLPKKYKSTITEFYTYSDTAPKKEYTYTFSYFENGFACGSKKHDDNYLNESIDSTFYFSKKPNLIITRHYYDKALTSTTKTISTKNRIKEFVNGKLVFLSVYNPKDSCWTKYNKHPMAGWKKEKTKENDKQEIFYEYKGGDTIRRTSISYKTGKIDYEYPIVYGRDSLLQYDGEGKLSNRQIIYFNKYDDPEIIYNYDFDINFPKPRYSLFEYVYDAKGNWIEKKEFDKNHGRFMDLDKIPIYTDYIRLYKRIVIY